MQEFITHRRVQAPGAVHYNLKRINHRGVQSSSLVSTTCTKTMVRRSYGAGLVVAAIAWVVSTSGDVQAFMLPPAAPGGVSRACSVPTRAVSSVSRAGRGTRAMSVAGGAVGNANKVLTDEEEGMRVAQIKGFTNKVRCVDAAQRC